MEALTTGTKARGILRSYITMAQEFAEMYVWWHGIAQDAGENVSDQELYRRAVLVLFAHARPRDSIAGLAGVLDRMDSPVP